MPYSLFYSIFLQETISPNIVNLGSKVNPYDASVYGFLIVFMMVIGGLLWRAYTKSQQDMKAEMDKHNQEMKELTKSTVEAINQQTNINRETSRLIGENIQLTRESISLSQSLKTLLESFIRRYES